MHIALWVGQIVLALVFLGAGAMKTFMPIEELGAKMPYVLEMPQLIRFIGISELAGGLGVILPALTRIRPVLTPIAALALGVVMILAGGFHATRGEYSSIIINGVLLGVAVFVGYGRLTKVPIEPRGRSV